MDKRVMYARREMAERDLARKRLLPFAARFHEGYSAGWAHKVIAANLEQFLKDVVDKKSPRLMLFMPPQTGKSLLVSDLFPSWALALHPHLRFILTSYSSSLPMRFSRYVRERVKSESYRALAPDTQLHPEIQSAEHWETTMGGGFRPVGVGGSITGHGAEIIIIDDPFKDWEEANSETIRATVHNWYPTTLRTRLQPGGGIININCLTGDTPITMADGTYRNIRDIRPGDEVLGYFDGLLKPASVTNWKSQGEDEVFEIRTGSSCVKANRRHPFLVERADGSREWVRTEDLAVGDKIVTCGRKRPGTRANIYETTAYSAIRSIKPAGVEEVFDIEVNRAESFLADGLVSHNTRWHDDDLSGWLLRKDKENLEAGIPEDELENWRILSLAALAENDEYVDRDYRLHEEPVPNSVRVRKAGDALHPVRHTAREWRARRAVSTKQQWSALYQQNPVPDTGEFFTRDDFQYYTSVPQLHDYPVFHAWDLAVGEKKNNDWTVGLCGALIPYGERNALYLLDMFRGRVRDKELYEAVVNMWMKYKQNSNRIGLEYGQLFLSVERPILEAFEKENVTPSWDRTLKPLSDKRVRATPARTWMQHHRIFLPKNAPWIERFESELLRFDAGVNDDIVDALAWLVRMVYQQPLVQSDTLGKPRDIYGIKSVEDQIRDYAAAQHLGSGTGYMAS